MAQQASAKAAADELLSTASKTLDTLVDTPDEESKVLTVFHVWFLLLFSSFRPLTEVTVGSFAPREFMFGDRTNQRHDSRV